MLLALMVATSMTYGQERTIHVAIDGGLPPFEYVDESGNAAGFLADTFNHIAVTLGYAVVYVPASPVAARTMLDKGIVDVRACMFEDSSKNAGLSEPLWHSSYSVMVRSDSHWTRNADIKNGSIATRAGDMAQTAAARLSTRVDASGEWTSVLAAVADGSANCAIVPTVLGARLIEERAYRGLKMLQPPIWHVTYRLEFGPGADALVASIESQLATMRDDGNLDAIGMRWLSSSQEESEQSGSGTILALLAATLTIAAIAIAWALVQRKRLARLQATAMQPASLPRPTLPEEHPLGLDAAGAAQKPDLSEESTTLIACLSRELRTPLHGVSGALQMLKPAHLEPEHEQTLEMAMASVSQLGHIMDTIDDVVDAKNGSLHIMLAELRFAEFAQSIEARIRQAAEAHGLTFRCTIQGSDRTIVSDAKRLGQIIGNLCDNAIEFTPHGEIDLLLALNQDNLRVIVRDTGPGLPVERAQELFLPHYKDEKGNPAQKLGLGLTMAKAIIDALHGTIAYKSSSGQGTEFDVTIPVTSASITAPVEIAATAEPPSLHQPQKHRRVIIAEDEAINRLYLKRVLELAGYHVAQAANGAMALESALEGSWDFILMDVSMPKMDGLEATRRIRAHEAGREGHRTPIIALTAHAYTEDRQACVQAGMDGFLSKPFTETALWSEIHRVLDSLQSTPPAQ